MASAYMNSIKAGFSPTKKGESMGSKGLKKSRGTSPTTPTRKNDKMSFGGKK